MDGLSWGEGPSAHPQGVTAQAGASLHPIFTSAEKEQMAMPGVDFQGSESWPRTLGMAG